MFKSTVSIAETSLKVGRKDIPWETIVRIREYDDYVLQVLSRRFPRAELFLDGGKTVAICNLDNFYVSGEKTDYANSVRLIKAKATNLKDSTNGSWVEWRLILPAVVFEAIVILVLVFKGQNIFIGVPKIIVAGVLGVGIGWIWERRSRRMLMDSTKEGRANGPGSPENQ